VTAWLSGAHHITISTVAMQAEIDNRWIEANGTVVNLIFGAIFWILMLKPGRYRPATRYFLVLAMMGNLFTGTGYFFFSGVSNFGDWAAVIHGLHPYWVWRIALVAVGVATYFASMLLVAAKLMPFHAAKKPGRIRNLCWTPYITDGILAGVAGLLNPAGLVYIFTSALPATLGANAGLFSLPGMIGRWNRNSKPIPDSGAEVAPIARSYAWIFAAAVLVLLYIFVIGRGITWAR
ncbi:MAG: hypothetical protein ACRD41_13125, partial [Candidatus Acidiferrales bacterium]